MIIDKVSDIDPKKFDLIFTALDSEDAMIIEPRLARTTPVISTAAAFRYENDVPILIPGVNDDHIPLLSFQRKTRGWKGFIAPLPNCTTTGLAISLKPIIDKFGIDIVFMTSMQALSGAGRSPGVVALDIMDNVIPYIPKEEEKVQVETKKILGHLNSNSIRIRKDTAFENGIKYILFSHNEKMGSAKGAVLLAELFKHKAIL